MPTHECDANKWISASGYVYADVDGDRSQDMIDDERAMNPTKTNLLTVIERQSARSIMDRLCAKGRPLLRYTKEINPASREELLRSALKNRLNK